MTYLLQKYITDTAKRIPEHIAIEYKDDKITYLELDKESNKLARALKNMGTQPRDRVGFCMHKNINSFKSIIGTLKADCTYVPLDAQSPNERLLQILINSEASVIICDKATIKKTQELVSRTDKKIKLLVLEPKDTMQDAANSNLDITYKEDIDSQSNMGMSYVNQDTDLCYIIYTSGSTGKPKGVMISHLNIINFINWAVPCFGLTENDRISNHPPLHFDLSTFDVYCAWRASATLVLVPPELSMFPKKLVEFIEQKNITVWDSVPSLLVYMARMGALEPGRMPNLKQVVFCGEPFPTKYVMEWMNAYPDKTFCNMYGPTETTCASTFHFIKESPKDPNETIPIGLPCDNTRVYVYKDNDELAGKGEAGELCISGSSVGYGYLNNQEKTQASFVLNPNNTAFPEPMYRTGDLVKVREDGLLEFIGRKDFQIKHMGYRIELGEIESAFYALPFVDESAVIATVDPESQSTSIIAFVTLNDNKTVQEIKNDLIMKIPKYMIPTTIHIRDALPRSRNGKIDRVLLKEQSQKTP